MRYAEFAAAQCPSNRTHTRHTWVCGGSTVTCEGHVAKYDRAESRDAQPCCADPLCPCDYKPGWGAYAAPAFTPDDLFD